MELGQRVIFISQSVYYSFCLSSMSVTMGNSFVTLAELMRMVNNCMAESMPERVDTNSNDTKIVS